MGWRGGKGVVGGGLKNRKELFRVGKANHKAPTYNTTRPRRHLASNGSSSKSH